MSPSKKFQPKSKKISTKSKTSKPVKKMGKGLSTLFPKGTDEDLNNFLAPPSATAKKQTTSDAETSAAEVSLSTEEISGSIQELPIDHIHPHTKQPRHHFDQEKLQELAKSIKQVGIIEPILVFKVGKKYQIIAGERRWRASKLAGYTTVPALVKEDNPQLLEIMLIENIQREDLSPIEEAASYKMLLEERGITQEELAERLGKSRSHITNLIRTLKLPKLAQEFMTNGTLSLGHAKVLLSYADQLDDELIRLVVEKEMTVRDLEKLLKSTVSTSKPNNGRIDSKGSHLKDSDTVDPNLKAIEARFRDTLKTKVKLHDIVGKVGKLEIDYYQYDDLESLLKRLED